MSGKPTPERLAQQIRDYDELCIRSPKLDRERVLGRIVDQNMAVILDSLTAAQQQGQEVAHPAERPVVWRILWTPQFPETAELTSDGERVLEVQALDDPPYIEPLYTTPPSAPVGVEDLIRRIDAAIERVTSGRCTMRVPADPTDPDLVLADAGNWIQRHALAQQPAAVDGATARRILTQYLASDPGDAWPPERQGEMRVQALQTAINSALAAQPGGSDNV